VSSAPAWVLKYLRSLRIRSERLGRVYETVCCVVDGGVLALARSANRYRNHISDFT